MQRLEHPDFQTLVDRVTSVLAETCSQAITERGAAALALAGGSTPMPVYRELAGQPLDWARVTLMPGDERWVAHDHPACNLRAIREAFTGTAARFASLTPPDPGKLPALDEARTTLANIDLPFDACVLGMGADGHFASLFPGSAELADALDPECALPATVVHPDPPPEDAPFARISLTFPPIAGSRKLFLLIRGERKRDALKAAIDSGDRMAFPIAALLGRQDLALEIHWSP